VRPVYLITYELHHARKSARIPDCGIDGGDSFLILQLSRERESLNLPPACKGVAEEAFVRGMSIHYKINKHHLTGSGGLFYNSFIS